ncbi:MAG: acetate--CoA ligase family protein [Deltaproteobacteria bacterium]|nr:acetate--CoA ligase family protein [Deltaproteobacteria bacterium]
MATPRSRTSKTASTLQPLFAPRSVALVGATARQGAIGRKVMENLLGEEFAGPVYAVNPRGGVVLCQPAFRSVKQLPEAVDLVIIAVPAAQVLEVVKECGKKGVKGIVIITAGFKEVGGKGLALEAQIREVVRKHGMRAIGPNCMGILNTDPEVRLNASFARARPSSGNVAFMSQSGALGDAILSYAPEMGVGISMFASMGNKMDVSGNDLLEYWAEDPHTDVILMYLESFGNPERFTQIARRVARKKPILAVKGGSTVAGARAAASHTGSLTGGGGAVDALFAECGVIRCHSVESLFQVAQALSRQPLPRGGRVAIITNAGGPGIMAADACDTTGLTVIPLSEKTQAKLAGKVNPYAALQNPVDLIASATPEDYRRAVDACLADDEVDAAIVLFVPPVITAPMAVAEGILTARAKHPEKPVLACFMSEDVDPAAAVERLREGGIPVYRFPESCVGALDAMVRYRRWLDRPEGKLPRYRVKKDAAEAVIAKVRADGRTMLTFGESQALLEAYGIPFAASEVVTDLDAALAAADRLAYPVVLKADDPRVVHKSDIGGVEVDLRDPGELVEAFRRIRRALEKAGAPEGSVRVQAMARTGTEVILGMAQDANLGPVILFGLGGIYVEILRQVGFKLPPLTDQDARELVDNLPGVEILRGARGRTPVDEARLLEIIERFGRFAADFAGQVQEVDLNPIFTAPQGSPTVAVDARVLLCPPS